MLESAAGTAFMIGIVSACSLPLGAITSIYWKPGDRAMAFLMAFGGGALLAALTIDLVGSALSSGHFYPLAIGCILGGLLFISLNEMVNDYGGFLRKASTTIYHIRRRQHQQFKRVLSSVSSVDIFRILAMHEFKSLAASMYSRDYKNGTFIFRPGDPPDALYVIADGAVEILNPELNRQAGVSFGKNDAFGWKAFLTGAPYCSAAVARADTCVWILPRPTFRHLLPNSPTLVQAVHSWLRSRKVLDYLHTDQHLTQERIQTWMDSAVQSLLKRGTYPDVITPERKEDQFKSVINEIQRHNFFVELPLREVESVASRMLYIRQHRGDMFFHKGDDADRLFIIEHGEVRLIDSSDHANKPITLHDHDSFAGLAFITGSRHSVSAIATEETTVWVLRKSDFEELLNTLPEFERHIKAYLQQHELSDYLQQRHRFSPDKAARWARSALGNIEAGRSLPAASELTIDLSEHKAAPLAIWLGLMLDSIPESLVIGASLTHAHISFSLIAGLFLSNYPESLSSSVDMRHHGFSFGRIVTMWTALMVSTGIFAILGNRFFTDAEPFLFAFTEGIAAGAMLTMIAQTMLPEAYFKGGSIVGFSTLLGFLTAIMFKTLE